MYSQCEQLLSVEESAAGGVFRPDVPDPEMSHASSTALWELSLLRVRESMPLFVLNQFGSLIVCSCVCVLSVFSVVLSSPYYCQGLNDPLMFI